MNGIDRHIKSLIDRIQSKQKNEVRVRKFRRKLRKATHRQQIIDGYKIINSENSKKFYKYVSKRLNSKDHLSILVNDEGEPVVDDQGKAELMKSYFESMYPSQEEMRKRHLVSASCPGGIRKTPTINMLNNIDSSSMNLFRQVRKLNNSNAESPDSFSTNFLKSCGYEICEPLTYILQKSLELGRTPNIFKTAIVKKKIQKKGDKSKIENKKNISLTSSCCKLFESIIAEEILLMLRAKI